MLKMLLTRLWQDEGGSVICTEYLMLGSIVAAGSASGMVAMRDAMVEEYKDFGDTIRHIRHINQPPTLKPGARIPGAVVGPAAVNAPDPVPLAPNPKFMVP